MQEHLGAAVLRVRRAADVQPLVPAEDGLVEIHLHGRPRGQQLQPRRGGEQLHLKLRAVQEPAALEDRRRGGDEDGEVEEQARGRGRREHGEPRAGWSVPSQNERANRVAGSAASDASAPANGLDESSVATSSAPSAAAR